QHRADERELGAVLARVIGGEHVDRQRRRGGGGHDVGGGGAGVTQGGGDGLLAVGRLDQGLQPRVDAAVDDGGRPHQRHVEVAVADRPLGGGRVDVLLDGDVDGGVDLVAAGDQRP